MNRSFAKPAVAASIFAAAFAPAPSPLYAAAVDQPINVVVNQVPVSFSGAQPQEMNGSVLVPLRGVFEQLGAKVSYDAASKQIQARKGSTLVVLTIGQTTAFVGGVPATLSQPAVVQNGTTLVPLRFVAQSFGAEVAWLPSSRTVVVNTIDKHVASLPPPPLSAGGVAIGTLTNIFPNTDPPRITLRVNGQDTSVPLSPDTIVLIRHDDSPAEQGTLGDLHVGDQVRVTETAPGAPATLISAVYGDIVGTVKSITQVSGGSAVITLNDGQTRTIQPGARVTMAGRPIRLNDILPDERVTLRTDPATGDVASVDVPAGGGYATENDGALAPASANESNQAAPAQATQPSAPNAPHISSFTVDSSGPVRTGATIHATLRGTPGRKASFSIPGVADSVPMQETSPGIYEGSFHVPASANVLGGSVLGSLTNKGSGIAGSDASAPLIQAAQTVTIDNTPPAITGQSPAPDSTVGTNRPRIYALTEDANGSGVDAQGTHMLLDGTDVTSGALVTAAFISYQPTNPLGPGLHTVRVTARDIAGNISHNEWSFTVDAAKGVVTDFTSNLLPGHATLLAGQPLNVTLRAQPGGTAAFSVGKIATDIPMQETSPGVYTGSFFPTSGSSAQSAPVTARYTAPNGTVVTTTLDQAVTIDAGLPAPPTITSPAPNTVVGSSITLAGTAEPGATVNVSISYHATQLGIFQINGKAADTQTVADKTGHWKTDTLPLSTPGGIVRPRNVTFTATATVVDANGQQSDPATVDFKHG